MKHILITLLALLSLSALPAVAEDGGPLPFSVTIGGQAVTHKAGEPFAKLDQPVAANAEIVLGAKADVIIINVHKAKADGTPDDTAAPAIILFQGTNKGTLDQTMDKQKLAPGKYLLSITAGERTASIQFAVK